MRCIALLSGGKDSWYALYLAHLNSFEIMRAVSFIPGRDDSYMLHHPAVEWIGKQCELAEIPHSAFHVSGEKEVEVEEMKNKLKDVVNTTNAECLVCGAVWSDYQKSRIDFIAEELGVMSYAPLWRKDEEMLLREMVEEAGFSFIVTQVAAYGLDEWAGKIITAENLESFIEDLQKARSNVMGEGGEYESFVTYMPLFKREIRVESFDLMKQKGTAEIVIHSLH